MGGHLNSGRACGALCHFCPARLQQEGIAADQFRLQQEALVSDNQQCGEYLTEAEHQEWEALQEQATLFEHQPSGASAEEWIKAKSKWRARKKTFMDTLSVEKKKR